MRVLGCWVPFFLTLLTDASIGVLSSPSVVLSAVM